MFEERTPPAMKTRADSARAIDLSTPQPTLIFLHIPKTGGMTMRRIIRRNYAPDERYELKMQDGDFEASVGEVADLSEEAKRTVRVVFGHTVYGVHEELPGPATYVSMLRRPTSLALSAYHFIRRRESNWLHEEVSEMSLQDFIQSDIARQGDNMQTRLVAGEFDWNDVCTEETLDRAKRNVDEHFIAVGLTERFDEMVLLWARRLGWAKPHYVRWNVTPARKKAPVPDQVLKIIEERNQFDAELYRYVAQRFEADIAAYPDLDRQLARFRRRNTVYRYAMRARPTALARRARARLAGR
jgi:hypothetical protein